MFDLRKGLSCGASPLWILTTWPSNADAMHGGSGPASLATIVLHSVMPKYIRFLLAVHRKVQQVLWRLTFLQSMPPLSKPNTLATTTQPESQWASVVLGPRLCRCLQHKRLVGVLEHLARAVSVGEVLAMHRGDQFLAGTRQRVRTR